VFGGGVGQGAAKAEGATVGSFSWTSRLPRGSEHTSGANQGSESSTTLSLVALVGAISRQERVVRMSEIQLTQGKVAIVNDDDYEELARFKWAASIRVDRKPIRLGYFSVESEAARAYDRAAIKHFGPYAAPNFSREEYAP